MKIKKYQHTPGPIWKQELDVSNTGVLPVTQLNANKKFTHKLVEQSSKGDKEAQQKLKKQKQEDRKKLRQFQRKKQNPKTVDELNLINLANAIQDEKDEKEISEYVDKLDPINRKQKENNGIIEDTVKVNLAKAQQNLLGTSYMSNPNGSQLYWNIDPYTKEGQEFLQEASRSNAESLLKSSEQAASVLLPWGLASQIGWIRTLGGLAGGIAGDQVGRYGASLVTDNPTLKTAAGVIGGTLGGLGGIGATNKFITSEITPRVYNYVAPLKYADSDEIVSTNHAQELRDVLKSFLNREKININKTPQWVNKLIDEDVMLYAGEDQIPMKAFLKFRDDAYRKSLGFPDRTSENSFVGDGRNTYIPNSDGTYSYDMDVVNGLRTKYGGNEFSGKVKKTPFGYGDNITLNGGHISVSPDGTYSDIWDVQPFKLKSALPFQKDKILGGISKAMHEFYPNFEMIRFLGGKPLKLNHSLTPTMDQFIGSLNQSINNSTAHTIDVPEVLIRPFVTDPVNNVIMRTVYQPWQGTRSPFKYPKMIFKRIPERPDLLMGFTKTTEIAPKELAFDPVDKHGMYIGEQAFDPSTFNVTSYVDPNSPEFKLYTKALADEMKNLADPKTSLFKAYTYYGTPKSNAALSEIARVNNMTVLSPHLDNKGNVILGPDSKLGFRFDQNSGKFIKDEVPIYTGLK